MTALSFPKTSEKVRPTERQERAIAALLRGRSLAASATAADVTVRTVYRWRTEDQVFIGALGAARDAAFAETLDSLRRVSSASVAACEALLKPSNRAEVRLLAARTILGFALKANDAVNFEERLKALEGRTR